MTTRISSSIANMTLTLEDHVDSDDDVYISIACQDEGTMDEAGMYISHAGRKGLLEALRAIDSSSGDSAVRSDPHLVVPEIENAIEAALAFAGRHGLTVSFRYDKKSGRGNIEHRRLAPSEDGLSTARNGAKIVVGYDPDRDDVRAYRIDRIIGAVTVLVTP